MKKKKQLKPDVKRESTQKGEELQTGWHRSRKRKKRKRARMVGKESDLIYQETGKTEISPQQNKGKGGEDRCFPKRKCKDLGDFGEGGREKKKKAGFPWNTKTAAI